MKKLLFTSNRTAARRVIAGAIFLFTLITTYTDGQTIINAGTDQSIACGASTTLNAAITPTQSTTSYSVNPIAYSPDPYNQGTLVTLGDDQNTTTPIPIGFSFCFYGNTYTNFYISSNNWIGFSPGQTSTWVTVPIPNASGAAPKNCIMAPWQDIHPGMGGQIRYAVYGTAPYRRLVVSYNNVPMYSCTGLLYTSQIKIYETTNVIETHISNKPLCTSWNTGRAVHGLQNANGTMATPVAGRNNTQWSTSNEGMRFTPAGAPAYVVEWLDPNNVVVGTGTQLNVTPNVTTSYTARLTYTCGNVQYTDQVQVALPVIPTPAFLLSNNVVCAGDVVTVTYNGNATPAANYTWNFSGATVLSGSGQGPYQIQWANAGTYPVTLSVSEGGCSSAIGGLPVTVNAVPTSNFTLASAACLPDTVTVTYTGTSIPSATFNWNFNGATVITGSGQGPYTLTWPTSGTKTVSLNITQNGCTSTTQTANISIFDLPTANFTVAASVCEDVALPVTYTGTGTVAANYAWSFGTNSQVDAGSGQGPYQVEWTGAGNYTVALTVTENGCISAPASQNFTVYQQPNSNFTVISPVCQNQATTIVYNGNATNAATFTWGFDSGVVQSGSNNGPYQVIWTLPGTKNVTLTVAENGCTSTQSTQQVVVDTVPVVNAGLDVAICSGDAAQIGITGTTGFTYAWSPATGLDDATIATPNVTLANNTTSPLTVTYILAVNNNGLCNSYDTVQVTVNPVPVVSYVVPTGQCLDGNQFNMAPVGSYSNSTQFDWTIDGASQTQYNNAPVPVTFTQTGYHVISVTATSGTCVSSTFTDSVQVFETPVANFIGSGITGCLPFKSTFSDLSTSTSGIASYNWDLGTSISTDQNPYIIYSTQGVYDITLTVTSTEGCANTLTMPAYVNANPVPVADFVATPNEVDVVFNPFVDIVDMSNGASSYWYNFGNGDTMITANGQTSYGDTGTYVITQIVTNQFGCADTAYRSVVAKPSHSFYVPTAFTPNQDGLNDTFKPQGYEVEHFTMNIYNRWGQLVYATDNMNAGWDGTFKNEMATSDVYTWRITYDSKAMKTNGRQVKEGMVTLLR